MLGERVIKYVTDVAVEVPLMEKADAVVQVSQQMPRGERKSFVLILFVLNEQTLTKNII